jgi:hypothetical protein
MLVPATGPLNKPIDPQTLTMGMARVMGMEPTPWAAYAAKLQVALARL